MEIIASYWEPRIKTYGFQKVVDLSLVEVTPGQGGMESLGLAFHSDSAFLRGIHKSLRLHIHAEVDDLEARALEHHGDQVLADVVQVALDRADGDLARGFGHAADQMRLEEVESRLHGARRRKQFSKR